MERIMTVTSRPSPLRKPAHSRAMYEAPTSRVFPGEEGRLKMSSEVMPSSRSPEMQFKSHFDESLGLKAAG
jgi:hypothetical protein